MREVEKTGKTIDEAVEAAILDLGVTRDIIDVEVIVEPNKGFLGIIGNKLAKVKVRVKETPLDKATAFLADVLSTMDIEVKLETEFKGEIVSINIVGSDLGVLIGRRGDTLDALQYLVNLVSNKNKENKVRFVLDVEGYRGRREQTLQRLAMRLADKVRRNGEEVVLEPMNPHERRVIHTALQNHRFVNTSSHGEEPYRKIVISPKR